jgi:hypothetical protein
MLGQLLDLLWGPLALTDLGRNLAEIGRSGGQLLSGSGPSRNKQG